MRRGLKLVVVLGFFIVMVLKKLGEKFEFMVGFEIERNIKNNGNYRIVELILDDFIRE